MGICQWSQAVNVQLQRGESGLLLAVRDSAMTAHDRLTGNARGWSSLMRLYGLQATTMAIRLSRSVGARERQDTAGPIVGALIVLRLRKSGGPY